MPSGGNMTKEPISLSLFRLFLGIALVILLAMIYWSTSLIEKDINELEEQIEELQSEIERLGEFSLQELQSQSDFASDAKNLLSPDSFYTKTLPEMLGSHFRPNGNYRQATIGKPKNLHPFSNWAQVSEWIGISSVTLANMHFGIYETMGPGAAIRMEERINSDTGGPEFWVFLRKNLYWQPLVSHLDLAPWFSKRHRVTAHDFKFYYDAMMNPFVQEAGAVASRTYYNDVESFKVIDDSTFVIRWKTKTIDGEKKNRYSAKLLTGGLRPLATFVYQYFPNGKKIVEDDSDPEIYRKDSVWAQNFSEHWAKNTIVSCGPWTFDGWNEKRIIFERNPRFFNRYAALMDQRTTTFKQNPDSPWQDFKSEKTESVALRPDQLVEWEDFQKSSMYAEQQDKIKRLDYLSRSYFFIGWNQASPFFRSQKVRQAMTMAIDRKRIIDVILNGLGVEITGPFFIGSPSYDQDIKPWPYDPVGAKRLLEKEGWYDRDGDGIRNKEVGGKVIPFSFSLTYYVKNDTTKSICEYVATALKKIGVNCQLNGVDLADLSAMFDDKSFDALSLGWGLGSPPEDPRQLWYSSGAGKKGSSNAVGFSNQEADQIIDALEYEFNRDKRIAMYHRFHQIIHEEAPYTFLYTPKTVFLYRSHVQNVFIPSEQQDLIPGANVLEPQSSIFWLKESSG